MAGKIVSCRCKVIDSKWPRQAGQLSGLRGVSVTLFPSKAGKSVVKAIRLFETWN